jgi:hypothetical protein
LPSQVSAVPERFTSLARYCVQSPAGARTRYVEFEIGTQIPALVGSRLDRLVDALAIGAIEELGGEAAGDGNRERPVLAVIGEAPGLAVEGIGERVAIGVIADRLTRDR